MSTLTREIELLHNPALGAFLLWRTVASYANAHPQHLGMPLPAAFLVLPLTWHRGTAEPIESTQAASGLRKFAAKFTETNGARDVLLNVNERMVRWRGKTMNSLRVAVAAGLLLPSEDARLVALQRDDDRHFNRTVHTMADNCTKLGEWFAPLTLHEVGLILRVNF